MKGFSTIIAMFVFMSMLAILIAGMTFVSISTLKSGSYITDSQTTRQYSESCVEEVLRKLKDDILYTGGIIPLTAGASCNNTVSGNETLKTLSATVSSGNFQTNIMVDIEVVAIGEAYNFIIRNWQEN